MANIQALSDQAIQTVSFAIDQSYMGRIVENRSTTITIDMSDVGSNGFYAGQTNRFFGIGLRLDADNKISGGLITGYEHARNGIVDFRLDGLNITGELFNRSISNLYDFAQSLFFATDDIFTGSSRADQITSYDGNDTIESGAGNDTINADRVNYIAFQGLSGAGNDYVSGGSGSDQIDGGGGNDHLYGFGPTAGDDGNDTIYGGDGSDYIQGNSGNDQLYGMGGSDRIQGGAGDDRIEGEGIRDDIAGSDSINGNKGNDTINGGGGNDLIRGGQGNDQLLGGAGRDALFGDLGNDTISGGSSFDFAQEIGPDVMTGGEGSDLFRINAAGSYVTNSILVDAHRIADFEDGIDRIRMSDVALKYVVQIGVVSGDMQIDSIGKDYLGRHADKVAETVFIGSYQGDALIYRPGRELVILDNFDMAKLSLGDFTV